MTLLALAVSGRGVVDPDEPAVHADDEAFLRGRGASMGALGLVRPNGDLDLALTIRTFAVGDGRIHLWVGGGIVWDSEPQAEIEESWVKARPLLAAVGAPLPEPVAL